ncbi:DUF4358 domain-containing protein [Feifania hominis]|uniref:DUF4358 domain-containing protein n=1 Tax=Feifania hominis TaxID=2763660 RepID=A0A926HTK2_9FIRM|nr:DUF4358 domain-containing protein [Feifania hominis]MBC8535954.1 DUF4358 domain-containing protein [Feifania hominis]
MKRLFLCLLVLTVLLTGCAGSAREVDLAALGEELFTSGVFSDELDAPGGSVAGALYDLPDQTETTLYISSGATAEELALFRAASDADAKLIESAANRRLTQQKTAFEGYLPDECEKLDRAVIRRSGRYVVLCVAHDADTAQQIIEHRFK